MKWISFILLVLMGLMIFYPVTTNNISNEVGEIYAGLEVVWQRM